jgi:hypothetical protein
MRLEGGCYCEALRYVTEGEPPSRACRRANNFNSGRA